MRRPLNGRMRRNGNASRLPIRCTASGIPLPAKRQTLAAVRSQYTELR